MEFLRWRWAPFVGLVGASLFYVLLAVLLIPSQVGAAEPEPDELGEPGEDTNAGNPETGDAPAEPSDSTVRTRTIGNPSRPALPVGPATLIPKRRGFSPPLERPEAPPPEAVAPPPAPPPAPVPPPPAPAVPVAPPTALIPPSVSQDEALRGAAAAAQAANRAATRASRLAARRGVLANPNPSEANDENAADAEDEDESGDEEAPANARNADDDDENANDNSEGEAEDESEEDE